MCAGDWQTHLLDRDLDFDLVKNADRDLVLAVGRLRYRDLVALGVVFVIALESDETLETESASVKRSVGISRAYRRPAVLTARQRRRDRSGRHG